MSLPRTWHRENYADVYNLSVTADITTSLTGEELLIPTVLYSVTLAIHTNGARVSFHDVSSTADTDEKFVVFGSSSGTNHTIYPRGLVFEKGIVVVATGGALNNLSVTYHPERLV